MDESSLQTTHVPAFDCTEEANATGQDGCRGLPSTTRDDVCWGHLLDSILSILATIEPEETCCSSRLTGDATFPSILATTEGSRAANSTFSTALRPQTPVKAGHIFAIDSFVEVAIS